MSYKAWAKLLHEVPCSMQYSFSSHHWLVKSKADQVLVAALLEAAPGNSEVMAS